MLERRRAIRVLLVEDHGAVRRGLELFLTAQGLRVTAAVDSSAAALECVEDDMPDVAVVDLVLRKDSGLTCIELLRRRAPRVQILAYSGSTSWPLSELLDAGVRGFALKAGPPERLLEAVEAIACGRTYIDPDFDVGDEQVRPGIALTDRERQVLGLLSQGLTGSEVATRLFLSPATVRTHIQNAMRKLGARTRVHAIALANGESERTPAATG
jgi:DNA-binding NarL/FixJ family response regulator